MKIVGALLCRNEEGRYLEEVLTDVARFCDEIVVVDDGSTDGTAAVCNRHTAGASVTATGDRDAATTGVPRAQAEAQGFWGSDETTPRARLWDLAAEAAGLDGWIYG